MHVLSYGFSPLSNYCECDKKTKKNSAGKRKHISPFCTRDKAKTAVCKKHISEFIIKLLCRDFFWVTERASGTMGDKLFCPVVLKKET
jgi:hypothetical protein